MSLLAVSMHEQSRALTSGAVTALELVEASLERVQASDPELNALTQVFATEARRRAEDLGRAAPRGPLHGIVWAAKDNLATRLGQTTCGSALLRRYRSPYDATVVQRLQQAGAVLLGRANCDEFAMGSTTEHSAWGPTRNPWNPQHVPGGSSGGSAAAVAAGYVGFSLGSDTGGSVRQPAAWCGIVGLKPTWGRLSRYGLVSFANSFDHVGIFTRSVRDAGIVLECCAGADAADATTLQGPLPPARGDGPGWRLGLPWDWIDAVLGPEERQQFARATEVLQAAGATLQAVSLPGVEHAARCYHVLAAAEAATQLARYDGMRYGERQAGGTFLEALQRTRSAGLGAEVKKRILLGTFVLTAGRAEGWLHRARRLRDELRHAVRRTWHTCDTLLLPTTPTPAARLGEFTADALKMVRADTFTTLANLTGIPAISIPSGQVRGLPMGLQLHAPAGEDRQVLRIAAWAEAALGVPPRSFPAADPPAGGP